VVQKGVREMQLDAGDQRRIAGKLHVGLPSQQLLQAADHILARHRIKRRRGHHPHHLAIHQLVEQLLALGLRQSLQPGDGTVEQPAIHTGLRGVGQEPPGDRHGELDRRAPQRLDGFEALLLDPLSLLGEQLLRVGARPLEQRRGILLGSGMRLLEGLVALLRDRAALPLDLGAQPFGRGLGGVRLGDHAVGPLLALGDDAEDRPIQEML
jgi:hypothetical protein